MITKTKKTSLTLHLHQEETIMKKIKRDQVTDVSITDNRDFKTVVKRTSLMMISKRSKKTSMVTSNNNNPEEKRGTSNNKKNQKTWMMKLIIMLV